MSKLFALLSLFTLFTLLVISSGIQAKSALQASNDIEKENFRPIVHHEILAQINPDIHKIDVVDVIQLAPEQVSSQAQPLSFFLHAGKSVNIQQKNIRLEKLTSTEIAKYYPNFVNGVTAQNVPVDVYFLHLPANTSTFTLSYSRIINHDISSGAVGARAINDTPGLINEKGVYLAAESLWFPRFKNELLTFKLSVRLPAKWQSVSQGARIYQENEVSYHLDTWQELNAQDDIYLVAAKFVEYKQSAGKVDAMAFLRTADDALAQKYLDATTQYLEMYQSLLGVYPYKKFALVENFWNTGFGMPSFTLLGSQIIRFPFILHSSYPHELLHNWWGNSVYVDYTGGNWAEGLTAYLADHLIREQHGKANKHRQAVLQKYTNFTQDGRDFALKDFISRNNDVTEAVGYGKTLMLFHMLRLKLSDEIFNLALQRFYQKYQFSTAGYKEIEAVFSSVSKMDLKHFFDTWVQRVGAPSLQIEHAIVNRLPNGKYHLQADIIQSQKVDAYTVSIPVIVTLENTPESIQHEIHMTTRRHKIDLEFTEKPIRLDVDPEFDVFRRLDLYETPPSLSKLFGAPETLIILPAAANKNIYRAFMTLAKTWQSTQQQTITIKDDKAVSVLPKDKAIWIFGKKNKFKAQLNNYFSDYSFDMQDQMIQVQKEKLDLAVNSVVLVARNPKNETLALGYLSADIIAAIPGLGRKLPHYGKYSFLGFEGDAPDNIAKGQWNTTRSPLSHMFNDANLPMAKLASRTPLASLAPVFSKKEMIEAINVLAGENTKGRGLNTSELDDVAKFIATKFKAAGLKSPAYTKNYFQTWSESINGEGGKNIINNVIAVLPGTNPKYKDQAVIVAAHYDHLGLGEHHARHSERGKIHYGADDNASGVAVMLEMARIMAKSGKPERSIVFIAFSAEEHNMLGSRHFVKTMPYKPENIMGVVVLDTVGRLFDNALQIFGTGTASEWVHIFRGAGFVTGVNVKPVKNSLGASDDRSFTDIKIPAVHFFSGVTEDFHKPTDTVDKLDYAGLVKVAAVLKETIIYLAAREIAMNNQLLEQKAKRSRRSGNNKGRSVSLGTVPDFTFTGVGVRVTDVSIGSPAERSGIRPEDILTSINGQKISNLRDFSQALKNLKLGDAVKLKIKRGNEKLTIDTNVVER